jgi:hypothetical protein
VVTQSELSERAERVGDECVSTGLVPWKLAAISEQHAQSSARQEQGSGAAGRTGTDDEDIRLDLSHDSGRGS